MESPILLYQAATVLIELRSLSTLTGAPPASSRSRFSLSPTPDPNDPVEAEELRQEKLRGENEAYRDLIQDGWRPSHCPSESNFDFLYEPENHIEIISYWTTICPIAAKHLGTAVEEITRLINHVSENHLEPDHQLRAMEEERRCTLANNAANMLDLSRINLAPHTNDDLEEVGRGAIFLHAVWQNSERISQARYKTGKNGPQLKEGDRVYLLTKNLKTRKRSRKLDHVKVGPFLIAQQRSEVSYRLQLPQDARIHPVFHISLLEPAEPSTPLQTTFEQQRWRWEKFRKHQDWRRWRYWKPEWFEQFVQEVREYRRKKGLEGDICLLQDRKEQSRLEDWVEFQYWEYRKADRLVKEIERYAEGMKRQEKRLQAAIDTGRPADEIKIIREHSLALMKGGRGTAKTELERQNVLLKWIDEQLPIIASERQTPTISTHVPNDCQSTSIGTSLGKRKRLASQTGHAKDSRRRVKFVEPCNTELLPVKNTDDRDSRLAGLPKSQAPRTPNTRQQHYRNAHQEAGADGDVIHTSDISGPVHRKSSPKRTNSSRRDRTRVNPVQTQRERRSIRAGSNTGSLRQQPAATPAEEEITFQEPKAHLATSAISSKRRSSTAPAPQSAILRRVHSSRVSKARGRTRTQVSPEAAPRDDTRWSPRKGKQREKPATPRDGKNSVKGRRRRQHLANAPVRRSPRLEGKPAICYSR